MKLINSSSKYLIWALFLILNTTVLIGQQSQKFQLLDHSTHSPIIGATYEFAEQSGMSDLDGFIEFLFIDGETMKISHIGYGKKVLNDAALRSIIDSGIFHWKESIVNLYPVTIIALHPKTDEVEAFELDYQDKMAHDGGAVLNSISAINSIRKSGNYGFDPVLRGFKYDQLNIVLNGAQSATAACPNRMDPPTSQMAPNMMNRIEILKGPHALRYGNSFGGTINFVSSKPRFTDSPDIYGRISGGYETNGDLFRNEGLIGFSGQQYDLGLFASWSQGKDYLDGEGNKTPADFLRGSFGTNLGIKLTDKQTLTLSATRNLARDADFAALPMDLREDDTWMLNTNYGIQFGESALQSWNAALYGTFVDHRMDNLLKNLDPRIMNAETIAKTQTYGGRTEGKWKFQKGILFAGADLRVEKAEGNRIREFLMGPNAGKTVIDNAWQNGMIQKSGLFAEYHHQKNTLHLIFSGRLELNLAEINEATDEFMEVYPDTKATQINPGFSAGVIKNLENDISLGLWVGRTQRSGSLTERYINYFPVGQDPFEMLGNPQLDPEINNQIDLTFEYKTVNTAFNIDLFAAFLQDNISSVIDTSLSTRLPNSPGVRQFVNIDKAFKTGFEIGWNQKLFAGMQQYLSIAYTLGEDLEREEPLPEIAPLDIRYSLSGTYLKNKLRPELTLRHVLKQGRISEEFGETTSPSFTILDLAVSYKFNKVINVSAGAQNLFDELYYEHLSRSVKGNLPHPIYNPGRTFFLSFSLDFM